ncbi:hypothetical protein BJ742DRAFT_869062 [Cladochytrium replicatum]|nr:hypothetical protein BJ742DRAFT_869062 [Cladochytrium replicatum]
MSRLIYALRHAVLPPCTQSNCTMLNSSAVRFASTSSPDLRTRTLGLYRNLLRTTRDLPAESKRKTRIGDYVRSRIREDFRAGIMGSGAAKAVASARDALQASQADHESATSSGWLGSVKKGGVKDREAAIEKLRKGVEVAERHLEAVSADGDAWSQLQAGEKELEALRSIVSGAFEQKYKLDTATSPIMKNLPKLATFTLLDNDANKVLTHSQRQRLMNDYVSAQLSKPRGA